MFLSEDRGKIKALNLWFLDSPAFSVLASFCALAGNSTITLRYDILEQKNCFFWRQNDVAVSFLAFFWSSDN